MATKTVISTDSFIFKNNETFLSQQNWQSFFTTAAQEGFTNHIGGIDLADNTKFAVKPYTGIVRGVRAEGTSKQYIDVVTSAEVDCLIGIAFSGSNPQLVKYTGIKSNANNAITFLSQLLFGLSDGLETFWFWLQQYGGISDIDFMLPIAYGIYGHGYWDLSQLLKQSGKPYNVQHSAGYAASVETPLCGQLYQDGLSQIYGNHTYRITLKSSYNLGEYYLYPVPACSMDPASIYIKNETSGAVTIKLPLTYRDLYFDYFTDNNWTESSGFKCYSLTAGEDMFIKMTQVIQETYTPGGVNPKSVYEISRGMEDVIYNDVYSKSEADALFETQTAATTALALKADASDVYTKTQADSLINPKANAADVYSKTEADNLFETQSAATTALAAKADADDTYTKSEVDALIEDIPVISTVYTKTQTDALLAEKADTDDVYSKSAADALLDTKANVSGVYSKSEANTLLNAKANTSDVYTKAQADTLLSEKANTDDVYSKAFADTLFAPNISPAFSGQPTAPTASPGTNTTQIATTAFVQSLLAGKANTSSPTFTGQPKAPTAPAGTNTTQLATTAFVRRAVDVSLADKANTDSPTFTGEPKAPTANFGDNSTKIATTAFVQSAVQPSAVTLYVNATTGSDTTGDGTQSAPFKTIQKAIDTFPHGVLCTLYVAPDTYNEAIVISGKIVTIRSTAGAGSTIYNHYNGSIVDYALTVTDGSVVTLRGNFTFWSTGGTIQTINGGHLIYAPSDYYVDKLALIKYTGSDAGTVGRCLVVSRGGRVTVEGEINVGFEGTVLQNSYGVFTEHGALISIETLKTSGAKVAVYNYGSFIICGSLSGNYTTASETEAGGITNIGTQS